MANEKMVPMNATKMSLGDVLSLVEGRSTGRWGKISRAAGTVESVLASGTQLETEDILNEILTVGRVEIRDSVDATTGVRSTFPILTFEEKPNCYYNAGTLLAKNVMVWARDAGDDPEEDKTLPNLNEAFAAEGGPQIILYQKPGKKYTSVYVM